MHRFFFWVKFLFTKSGSIYHGLCRRQVVQEITNIPGESQGYIFFQLKWFPCPFSCRFILCSHHPFTSIKKGTFWVLDGRGGVRGYGKRNIIYRCQRTPFKQMNNSFEARKKIQNMATKLEGGRKCLSGWAIKKTSLLLP